VVFPQRLSTIQLRIWPGKRAVREGEEAEVQGDGTTAHAKYFHLPILLRAGQRLLGISGLSGEVRSSEDFSSMWVPLQGSSHDAACDSVAPQEAPRCHVMGSTAVATVFASAELLEAIILPHFTRREAAQVRYVVLDA